MILLIFLILLQSVPITWCDYNQVRVNIVCFKDCSLNEAFKLDSVVKDGIRFSDKDSLRIVSLCKIDGDICITEWKESGVVMAGFFKRKSKEIIGLGVQDNKPVLFLGDDSSEIMKKTVKYGFVRMYAIRPEDDEDTIYSVCSVDDLAVIANAYVYDGCRVDYVGTYDINRGEQFPRHPR